mgnify:CR=1 FL=1
MPIPLTVEQANADPRIIMAQRIAHRRKMDHNSDLHGCCLFCRDAFRDSLGNVQCGIAQKGEGHVISRPAEEGCRNWHPREGYQPIVHKLAEQNKLFAKRVRLMELAAKGVMVNPLGMI